MVRVLLYLLLVLYLVYFLKMSKRVAVTRKKKRHRLRHKDRRLINDVPTGEESVPIRTSSLIKTAYLNLAVAIGALLCIEYVLFQVGFANAYANFIRDFRDAGTWLPLLVAFVLVSRLARREIVRLGRKTARRSKSRGLQYAILFGFVLLKAVLLAPLLWHASQTTPDLIVSSAVITSVLALGLTFYVFTTKSDFSFLGGALRVGGILLLGSFILRLVFGLDFGWIFALIVAIYAMVRILYRSSRILQIYNDEQAVIAALDLFASVTMLFASVLRLQRRFNKPKRNLLGKGRS